ncbi:hypothetical protein [Nonomuraea zeae]|uniref:Uncharacterized protein n=1 Tax=Nonomuraea zeae TaxID=1642303 RepID=A0A5S4FBC1_9ACTN|nr:hypothetical protein [Nonomuraea zeae]TMR15043.1 hypothetical protein ETD85_56355 [Nonomuraea zeae]
MITAADLERERRRSLARLDQVRREWERRHGVDGVDGADRPATAQQEEEFHREADEAMAPYRRLAEEYARQQAAD